MSVVGKKKFQKKQFKISFLFLKFTSFDFFFKILRDDVENDVGIEEDKNPHGKIS